MTHNINAELMSEILALEDRISRLKSLIVGETIEPHARLDQASRAIGEVFGIDDIWVKSKKHYIVLARRVFFYVARDVMGYKLPYLAEYSGMDHGTIVYHVRNFVEDAKYYTESDREKIKEALIRFGVQI